MRDWTEIFLCFILLAFGVTLAAVVYSNSKYTDYVFEYSYTEDIDGSQVENVIKRCMYFDRETVSLNDVKAKFIKDAGAKGKLSVSQSCDKSFMGTVPYPKIVYSVNKDNSLNADEDNK